MRLRAASKLLTHGLAALREMQGLSANTFGPPLHLQGEDCIIFTQCRRLIHTMTRVEYNWRELSCVRLSMFDWLCPMSDV